MIFTGEAVRLEKFIAILKGKTLWIVALTICIGCCNYVANNFSAMPEKYLEHQQYAETLSALIDQQERQSKLIRLYEISIEDVGPLLAYYRTRIGATDAAAKKDLGQFRLLADRTAARLRSRLAESEGIYLQGESAQKLHTLLLEGTKLVLELTEAFKASSASLPSHRVRLQLADKYQQVMLKNASIAESVIPAFTAQATLDRHNLERKLIELRGLNRQSWLVLGAALYPILFGMVALVTYLRFRSNGRGTDT